MPEKLIGGSTLADANTWATTLIAAIDTGAYKSKAASWIAASDISNPITSATAWATDANALVCSVVMPKGVAALQTGDLYPTYYNSAIGTIELQIAKGGYRLADWLNKIAAASAKRDLGGAVMESRMAKVEYLPVGKPNAAQIAREAFGEGCGCDRHKHKRGSDDVHE